MFQRRYKGYWGAIALFCSYALAVICGLPFLILILIISLMLSVLDRAVNERGSFVARFRVMGGLSLRAGGSGRAPHPYLYLACFFLAATFLLIPMGSLPPYICTSVDSITLLVLLLAAQFLYIRGVKHFSSDIYQKLDDTENFSILRFSMTFMVVDSCLAFYMLGRGVPGSVTSLESVAATSIWQIAGAWGRTGVLCSFLLLAVTSPHGGSKEIWRGSETCLIELYDAVRRTIGPAVCAAIFLPWNAAALLGLYGNILFMTDFIVFWLKVLLLQIFIFPAVRKGFDAFVGKTKNPEGAAYITMLGLGMGGATFFLLDVIF